MDRAEKSNNNKIFTIANALTSMRIIGAGLLMLCEPLSSRFITVYSVCGVSDGVDGFAARKTGAASEFGAKLDSAADLLFYGAMFYKVMPTLREILPHWLWMLVNTIIVIRIISYGICALRDRNLASLHTILNKLSGLAVFFIPYFLLSPYGAEYCMLVGAITAAASVWELAIHMRGRKEAHGTHY